MSIPDFQSIMLPLLKFIGDGKEYSLRETIEALAGEFELTEGEIKQLLPSGQQTVFDNRVGWARTYMKKASLLKTTRRGYFQITKRGQDILKQNPSAINTVYLRQFPEFIEFQTRSLTNFFSHVFSATSDFQEVKKSNNFYAHVCKILDVDPRAVVHIGDHWVFDFINPRRIGINAYFLDRDHTTQIEAKENEKFVISNLGEVLERLGLLSILTV